MSASHPCGRMSSSSNCNWDRSRSVMFRADNDSIHPAA